MVLLLEGITYDNTYEKQRTKGVLLADACRGGRECAEKFLAFWTDL